MRSIRSLKSFLLLALVMVLAALMLAACGDYTPITSTPTRAPTEVVPTPVEPSPVPATSTTVAPTATLPPPVEVVADVSNPGFEGAWADGFGGSVPVGWTSWACDGCPALDNRQEGRHEIVPTHVGNRVHSGNTAVKAFEFSRPGDYGIYTDVAIPDGSTSCTFSAWVQAWSANEWADSIYPADSPDANIRHLHDRWTGYGRVGFNPDGTVVWANQPYTSDIATADDRRAFTFRLGAGETPGNPLSNNIQYSDPFGFQYLDGGSYTIYDHYTLISAVFPASGPFMRFVIRATNLWGQVHNDAYIDDVGVVCNVDGGLPQGPTRTPRPTDVPAATQEPRQFDPSVNETAGTLTSSEVIPIFQDHSSKSAQTNRIPLNKNGVAKVNYDAIWTSSKGVKWACTGGGYWVEHPDLNLYIWACPNGWAKFP
jgi:hypothetical protein